MIRRFHPLIAIALMFSLLSGTIPTTAKAGPPCELPSGPTDEQTFLYDYLEFYHCLMQNLFGEVRSDDPGITIAEFKGVSSVNKVLRADVEGYGLVYIHLHRVQEIDRDESLYTSEQLTQIANRDLKSYSVWATMLGNYEMPVSGILFDEIDPSDPSARVNLFMPLRKASQSIVEEMTTDPALFGGGCSTCVTMEADCSEIEDPYQRCRCTALRTFRDKVKDLDDAHTRCMRNAAFGTEGAILMCCLSTLGTGCPICIIGGGVGGLVVFGFCQADYENDVDTAKERRDRDLRECL